MHRRPPDRCEHCSLCAQGSSPSLAALLRHNCLTASPQYGKRLFLRLEDLAAIRQASSSDLLLDFRQSQDSKWRRDTLALP